MNLTFLDTIAWDYDVATPMTRPLGGSQSVLCYLAVELGAAWSSREGYYADQRSLAMCWACGASHF